MWREYFPNPKVNDIHSELSQTTVSSVIRPRNAAEVRGIIQSVAASGQSLSIAGARHSMGGQQFLADSVLVDTSRLSQIHELDSTKGIVRVQAGCRWPELIRWLEANQKGTDIWTIQQKQTGADRLSLGGAVSSNIHSRGLKMKPFVNDIEAVHIFDVAGDHVRVDREHPLWKFVVGGYGLFGFIESVEMRLVKRHKIRRRVEIHRMDGLMDRFNQRITDGFEFGDFQFAIDTTSDDFLNAGVFSCYEPVPDSETVAANPKDIPRGAWHYIIGLAHTNKSEAYRIYSDFYMKTDGQIYWSDRHQLTPYLDGYHRKFDRRHRTKCKGSEMITELYVPRESLEDFISECRTSLRNLGANVIYGTIRLVEAEDETFLRWAKDDWACIIFNLHVDHDASGIERAKNEFRTLIDIAQSFGGSFYLTYHPWATKSQIELSYPQMREFFSEKLRFDPNEVFQSNWYRGLKQLLSE